MDVERALLQKGVHPASICALLRESCDLKGRINLPGAPMSSPFPYARGARQGSVEGLDCGIKFWTTARWESEKIGFKLAADYCRLRKRRRCSFPDEDMNGTEELVLHHLCWADDLYAMAESIEHLILLVFTVHSPRALHQSSP